MEYSNICGKIYTLRVQANEIGILKGLFIKNLPCSILKYRNEFCDWKQSFLDPENVLNKNVESINDILKKIMVAYRD